MVERQNARDLSILTEVESAALNERKGLRQRARALQALAKFAAIVGLNEDTIETMAGRIRSLDAAEAKEYRKTFEKTSSLFPEVVTSELPLAADEVPQESQASESLLLDELAVLSEHSSTETEESVWPQLSLREVQSFYKTINKKAVEQYLAVPQSDDEIEMGEVIALLELYARNNPKPSFTSRTLDKILKSLEVGAVKAADELGTSAASLNTLRFGLSNKIAGYLDELMQKPYEPQAAVQDPVTEAYTSEPTEGNLASEMEPHEQLIERYAELFGFDSAEKTAFRCIIEPKNRGDMTANKERVVETIRTRLEFELGSLVKLRDLMKPVERVRVSSLLGFHIKEKTIGDQPPQQLTQQLRLVTNIAEKRAQIQNLYRGLEAVADLLEGKGPEQTNVVEADFEHHKPAIKQVEIVDGKARLV